MDFGVPFLSFNLPLLLQPSDNDDDADGEDDDDEHEHCMNIQSLCDVFGTDNC